MYSIAEILAGKDFDNEENQGITFVVRQVLRDRVETADRADGGNDSSRAPAISPVLQSFRKSPPKSPVPARVITHRHFRRWPIDAESSQTKKR